MPPLHKALFDNSNIMKKEITVLKLIFLHLYPGLLIAGLYILVTPTINHFGYPSQLSLGLCFLVIILPFELGYLIRKSRTAPGNNSSLKNILVNEVIKKKLFIGLIIGGIIISILVAVLTQTIDTTIKQKIFSWLPSWYCYDEEFKNYSKNALILTGVLRVFIDGMIIPYIEEIYFRGYLLPRIKTKGLLAPITASILFAIYHFWQPWNYISLFIISLILVFPAWYFKNYKISLYIHLTINLIGSILFLLMITK